MSRISLTTDQLEEVLKGTPLSEREFLDRLSTVKTKTYLDEWGKDKKDAETAENS